MNIIIPMAGMGKRMRPHTLTVPKPLIKIAGKPIVQRLVEDIVKTSSEKIDEIAFIIGDFGAEVERNLISIASQMGATGKIYYQEEALGTAHAINCAKDSLKGKTIVAFADTLFRAEFTLDESKDGIIWVHSVEDPAAFGVVKLNDNKEISGFVEKPKEFISDLAIIGIYYFKSGEQLQKEIQYLIDNNISKGGEFQITDALENMLEHGLKMSTAKVDEWFDCGNKEATVYTNKRILELNFNGKKVDQKNNSVVIPPCYIAEGVQIDSSIVGPHVSVGKNTIIKHSIITNSIIQEETLVENVNIDGSMIGSNVVLKDNFKNVNLGDFTQLKSVEK